MINLNEERSDDSPQRSTTSISTAFPSSTSAFTVKMDRFVSAVKNVPIATADKESVEVQKEMVKKKESKSHVTFSEGGIEAEGEVVVDADVEAEGEGEGMSGGFGKRRREGEGEDEKEGERKRQRGGEVEVEGDGERIAADTEDFIEEEVAYESMSSLNQLLRAEHESSLERQVRSSIFYDVIRLGVPYELKNKTNSTGVNASKEIEDESSHILLESSACWIIENCLKDISLSPTVS